MPKKSSTPKQQNPPKKRNPSRLRIKQAPVAESTLTPRPRFRATTPTQGGCAAYEGVDYVGSLGSLSASVTAGSYTTISPSNTVLFPRLSAIADVFARYTIKKMKLHALGRSASTQAGNLALASLMLDNDGTVILANTEALIKNMQGCLVLRGWESGSHVVDCGALGMKWYNTDVGALHQTIGAVFRYISQTTANNDLSWDLYVEYEVEFDEALAGGSINLSRKIKPDAVPDIEDLGLQLVKLKRKIQSLEGNPTCKE